MKRAALIAAADSPPAEIGAALLAEARAIHEEDRQMCRAIGRHGAALLPDGAACSPTATPAAWPPPTTARPWP